MTTKLGLEKIDSSQWATLKHRPDRFAAWASSEFTVQMFHISGGIVRLSVNRNLRTGCNRLFADGISWDELQQIKDECGYADRMAVEIYPQAEHVLNIINARHLWILPEPLSFAWRSDKHYLNH